MNFPIYKFNTRHKRAPSKYAVRGVIFDFSISGIIIRDTKRPIPTLDSITFTKIILLILFIIKHQTPVVEEELMLKFFLIWGRAGFDTCTRLF